MMFLCFLFPFLLTSLPANYGLPLHHMILSESLFPSQSSTSRDVEAEHVRSISTAATSSKHVGSHKWKIMRPVNPRTAPTPSPSPQGPFPEPPIVFPRKQRHHRWVRTHPVSPSPSTESGCGQICVEPLTTAAFLSSCGCVLPIKVRLLLQVSLYAIFPVVRDLAMDIAEGTYVIQKQVSINGASADPLTPENTVVDINLIPLEEKFDNTTAMLIYTRLMQKKVHLNHSLFGDYEVVFILYPGLPSSPPFGVVSGTGSSPTGSVGGRQFPITADVVNKGQKLSPRVIFVIGSSAFVLLVVCCCAIVVLLKCQKAGRPSTSVGPAFAPPIYKRSGLGSILSTSPPGSSSTSLVSAMPFSLLSVKTFSLAELRRATDKFSSKKVLGEGGFGRVYHGILGDGSEVAVKLLSRDNQNGDREFIAEVEMLSRLHHRNLIKLIGICIEEHTRCLVYELVSNGNVEAHLHDKGNSTLDWDARLKIALGAARGLAYLHEDSNPRVIHRDFKASNVLLEEDFTPKVSDFGLAREATEGSHHISTRVMGTFGYVAPEYAMTGHLLVKSDVYSYGVVLLELLTGRKPVDMSQPPGQENLVTWARPLLTNREGVEQLVDPLLAGSYNFDDMAKVAAIASMCVHPEVTHRPFMGEVVQALKLIYNDADETGEDGHSQRESSDHGSDFKGDLVHSDSSWWNAGAFTPQLNYGQASSFITMEYSSPHEDFEKSSGRVALPIKHGNRSGPLRTIRSNPAFQRLEGSTSEHGGFVPKRAWNDVAGSDTSF